MKTVLKAFLMTVVVSLSLQAQAQKKETPPMEPPYTNDNEFDPVLGEDPAASDSAIPVTPGIEQTPTAQPANRPATKKPVVTNPPKELESAYGKSTSGAKQGYRSGYALPTYKKGQPVPKGVRLIEHPDAKKGLLRIEADGTYIYKVATTPKDQTGIIRFGFMDPPNIVSADGGTSFKEMYTSSPVFTLMADYEWQPFKKYGKLGVQGGLGFSTTTGQGRFLVPDAAGKFDALEKYTFIVLPINLGLIYRLEYFKRQWVAPYISGGGSYLAVAELRDDGKSNFTGTPAAFGAGGLMFNITALDKDVAFSLDSEYGVGNLWLVAEYRYQKSFSQDLDFTGGIVSFGISADF